MIQLYKVITRIGTSGYIHHYAVLNKEDEYNMYKQISNLDVNYGCEDCHRKMNGWGISRSACDMLADKILNKI